MDKLKLGSGKALRTEALAETALPVPYDPAAMPGACVLGTDGQIYASIQLPDSGLYEWSRLVAQSAGGGVLINISQVQIFNAGLTIGGTVGPLGVATGPARLLLVPAVEPEVGVTTGALGRLEFCSRRALEEDNQLASPVTLRATAAVTEAGWSETNHPTSLNINCMDANTPNHTIRGVFRYDGSFDVNGALAQLHFRVTADGKVLIGNTTGTERLSVTGNIQLTNTADSYKVGADNVVGSRKTGWAAPTGTATRTAFATSTVTTADLAERVKALIDDLTSHGLIGA